LLVYKDQDRNAFSIFDTSGEEYRINFGYRLIVNNQYAVTELLAFFQKTFRISPLRLDKYMLIASGETILEERPVALGGAGNN
jgi:hypothetical protein